MSGSESEGGLLGKALQAPPPSPPLKSSVSSIDCGTSSTMTGQTQTASAARPPATSYSEPGLGHSEKPKPSSPTPPLKNSSHQQQQQASLSSSSSSTTCQHTLINNGLHAAVLLSHFCEVHGPSVIYCQQMIHKASSLYSFPPRASAPTCSPGQRSHAATEPSKEPKPNGSSVEEIEGAPSETPPSIPNSVEDGSSASGIVLKKISSKTRKHVVSKQISIKKKKSKPTYMTAIPINPAQGTGIPTNDTTNNYPRSSALNFPKANNPFKAPDPFGSYIASSLMPRSFARKPDGTMLTNAMDDSDSEYDSDSDSEDISEDNSYSNSTQSTPEIMSFPGLSPSTPPIPPAPLPPKDPPSEPKIPPIQAVPCKSNPPSSETKTPSKVCSSCDTFSDGGFISFDEKLKCYFLSYKTPHTTFYSTVRSAAVRSLSCELSPNGREGSFFFSSDDFLPLSASISDDSPPPGMCVLHAVTYVFKLKDAQFSRGFNRWYSLSFLSHDKLHLIFSYDYLTSKFEKLVRELQSKADETFYKENPSGSDNAVAFPSTGGAFRRNRPTVSLRSLVDLVQVPDLYERIHSYFTSILKGYACSMIEKSLEKNQKLSLDSDRLEIAEFSEIINLINKALKQNELKWLIHHVIIGNQIIIRGSNREKVRMLIKFFSALLPTSCPKPIEFSMTYRERWECNILGVHSSCVIPDYLEEDSYLLIDMSEDGTKLQLMSSPSLQKPAPSTTLGNELLNLFQSVMSTEVKVLQLKSINEQWANKAKVLFSLSKTVESECDTKVIQFLKLSKLQESDIQILKFWTTGLKHSLLRKKLFAANVAIL